MKLKTFLSNSVAYYKSGKSIMLKSGPGRGKTTTIIDARAYIEQALGKSMGISIVNTPLLTPMDAQGYLMPEKGEDGRLESHYTRPFWWTTSEGKRLEEYDGGIVFLDEVDKADLDVKKILGEMALSGRCGEHTLPKGWVVWMAGNRAGDRSGSTKELDHLINRRFEIEVTDDLPGWVEWAVKHDVHYSLIGFAESNPQIVFPEQPPERQGPFCTPRSLVATGELLLTMSPDGKHIPSDETATEMASGGIGQAAAAQLMATLKLDAELPKIEEIIANPQKVPVPSTPDAQMLVAYKLAMLADERLLDPFITYVERLPADFSITFAKSICTRAPMLMATPAMIGWQRRNSSVMNIIAMLK